jgi:hypothetical protein
MEDHSRGKETRSLLPYLDLLDLHDLILLDEDAGKIAQLTLPGRLAPTPTAPLATVGGSDQFSFGLGPLPYVPPAPASGSGAFFDLPKADPAALPQGFALQATGATAVPGASAAKAAGGSVAAPGVNGGQSAKPAEADPGEATTLDGIRVRITQDADIDQESDASIEIRADDVEVSIRAEADLEVDQDAAIGIRAASAPAASSQGKPVEEVAIAGRQAIDIDTKITVDVTGYGGEVVVSMQLSEEADVDQDISATFRADAGDEVFDVDISQFIDIDLLSDLDIDIRSIDGRLYIDLSLKDVAKGEDTTRIDVTESADDILDVDLRQAADIDQRLSLDLDVEQELARLFDIDVEVDAEADVEVRQAADVEGLLGANGSADWDVEGRSEIEVDNELRIRIDFASS